jgi:hypothetical protein
MLDPDRGQPINAGEEIQAILEPVGIELDMAEMGDVETGFSHGDTSPRLAPSLFPPSLFPPCRIPDNAMAEPMAEEPHAAIRFC